MFLLFAIALLSTLSNADVNCGAHTASSCRMCPEGNGAVWCNGDCKWIANAKNCFKKESPDYLDCCELKYQFKMVPNVSWGDLRDKQIMNWWDSNNCNHANCDSSCDCEGFSNCKLYGDGDWCYLKGGLAAISCPGATKSADGNYYWSKEPCTRTPSPTLGESNTNECVWYMTAYECEKYAKTSDLNLVWDRVDTWSNNPKGCFESEERIYYNNGDGSPSENSRPICSQKTSYIGCFKDANARIMSVGPVKGKSFEQCMEFCYEQGSDYIGYENGKELLHPLECFCGTESDNFTLYDAQQSDSDCGNDIPRLGGAWRMAVYKRFWSVPWRPPVQQIYTIYTDTTCHGDAAILRNFIGTKGECELKCDELHCFSFTRTRQTGTCDFAAEDTISYRAIGTDCFEATPMADQDYNCFVGQGNSERMLAYNNMNQDNCQEQCEEIHECVGYDFTASVKWDQCRLFSHNSPRVGIGGDDNRMYCADLFVPATDENGEGTGSMHQTGDCKTVGFDTLNIGGKNRFHAVYIDCDGINKSFSMKVDVKDMLGIQNCPLINDWEYTIGCPGGVCKINRELVISVDICDVLAFIASAGAANIATKLGTSVAKKAIGQGIKSLANAQLRQLADILVDQISKKASDLVSSGVKGLCGSIASFIQQFLECLGGRGGIIKDISKGIAVILKVINKLFGSIMFKVNFGTEFHLNDLSFKNWKVNLALTWNMGSLSIIPRTILTGVARAVPSLRNGTSCDNWDSYANVAGMYLNFVPDVSARFVITCEPWTLFGFSLAEMGAALKDAANKIAKFMKKIGKAIGAALKKLGEGFVNFFTGRLSSAELNELKKTYHIKTMKCTIKCPSGWEHFMSSDRGCCLNIKKCFGDMDWCRIKKTYWDYDENNERRELIEKPTDTLETDVALIESLNTLSDSQLEEFVATFPQEEIERAIAGARHTHEERLADLNSQVWLQTHEMLTAEEEEVQIQELCRALDQHIDDQGEHPEYREEAEYREEVELEEEEERQELSLLKVLAELMAERE